ncbi:hypothetical protein BpHYR1_019332 [Brachionus plicatilis]|uniref:Uncharacterized protein n=1 Tax=Brachionus plicatilis TaxID=10195 RepID=A0A3M7QKL8_BRAPC|nr:hypothetical protein BpHYR1_019332 [Brachionus plicatilis]
MNFIEKYIDSVIGGKLRPGGKKASKHFTQLNIFETIQLKKLHNPWLEGDTFMSSAYYFLRVRGGFVDSMAIIFN